MHTSIRDIDRILYLAVYTFKIILHPTDLSCWESTSIISVPEAVINWVGTSLYLLHYTAVTVVVVTLCYVCSRCHDNTSQHMTTVVKVVVYKYVGT